MLDDLLLHSQGQGERLRGHALQEQCFNRSI
jgi:hypothetical protein